MDEKKRPSERFRGLAADIRVPQELRVRTLDAARFPGPAARRGVGPTGFGRRALSRRGFVAAACCAACAGVFFAVRGRVDEVGADRGQYGLQVARASESPAPLIPTGQGMAPIGTMNGLSLLFRLNLDVCGSDVSTVRYRVDESPLVTYGYAFEPFTRQAVAFRQGTRLNGGAFSFSGPPLSSFEIKGEGDVGAGKASTRRAAAQRESPYFVEVCLQPGELWGSDEVLALFGSYSELVRMRMYGVGDSDAGAFDEDELDEKIRDLKYRMGDLLADKLREGTLFDWMRRMYGTYLQLAGGLLAQSVLEVAVARRAGADVVRRYRITPAQDVAALAARHFDALLAQNGYARDAVEGEEGDGAVSAPVAPTRFELDVVGIPFWDFVDGELTSESAEAYGCEPLFYIAEAD